MVVGGIFFIHTLQTKTPPPRYVLGVVEKGTLTTSVSGSGQISASSQVDLKATGTGTVLALGVKKGDSVKQGQLLIQLNASDASKAVRDAKVNLQSAQLAYDKLVAAPETLTLLQAQNAVVQAEQNLASLKRALDQKQITLAQSSVSAYENGYGTVVKAFIDLPNVFSDLANLLGTNTSQDQYIGYYKILTDVHSVDVLVTDHAAAKSVYDDASASYAISRGTSENSVKESLIKSTLDAERKTFDAISDAHKMLEAIRAIDYSHSGAAAHIDQMIPLINADVTLLNNGISSLQSAADTIDTNKTQGPNDLASATDAVAQATANLNEKTQQLLNLKTGPSTFDIQSQLLTLTQRKNALLDAQLAYQDDATHAPMDGVVANMPVHVGDQVSSGSLLATIISPQQLADLSLNEVDVAKIKVGQSATLSFDAIDGLTLTGHVADIDSLGTVTQGVVSYHVKIVLDVVDGRVKSGMSVSAEILTEAHQNVLLVPTSAIKTQGNNSYVEVLDKPDPVDAANQGGTSSLPPRQVPVVVGLSNDTQTEIVSSLKEGDQIITKTIIGTTAAAPTARQAPSLFGGGAGGGGRVRVGG